MIAGHSLGIADISRWRDVIDGRMAAVNVFSFVSTQKPLALIFLKGITEEKKKPLGESPK